MCESALSLVCLHSWSAKFDGITTDKTRTQNFKAFENTLSLMSAVLTCESGWYHRRQVPVSMRLKPFKNDLSHWYTQDYERRRSLISYDHAK
jgi:hypothetical protein